MSRGASSATRPTPPGNRSASTTDAADPRAPTILFAGESIALGWGVAYDCSYPVLVGRALGLQVVDVAVTGFALDQAYLRLKDSLADFDAPVAVVTSYCPTSSNAPSTLEGNVSRSTTKGGSKTRSAIERRLCDFASAKPALLFRRAHLAARAILRATDEAARWRGARARVPLDELGPACLEERRDSRGSSKTCFWARCRSHPSGSLACLDDSVHMKFTRTKRDTKPATRRRRGPRGGPARKP